MSTSPCLLGIDLGTSSVKALCVTPTGQVVGRGTASYPILQPAPDQAEQDPAKWWAAVCAAVQAAVPKAYTVAAIGLSGQMHGTVLLDEHERLLAPAVIWPDRRSRRQVQEITDAVGAERLYAITGSPLATGFQAATVRWFQQEQPALWRQVHQILSPKDWLRWQLTGTLAAEPSDAAGTLLFNIQQRSWSRELAELLALDLTLLPSVQPSATVAGLLTGAAAAALGLPADIAVVTGAADTACSILGAGLSEPSTLLLSISTGGQLVLPAVTPQIDMRGRIHTFCSALEPTPGHAGWYQMGATLAAGLALRWLRDNVLGLTGDDAYATMNELAAASPPGARGLLFLPYLLGERTPHMDPTARSVFFGLTLGHGRGDLIRAVMEGVAFSCWDAYQVLVELGANARAVILAGGGARSAVWQQIIADIFGLPVRPLQTTEQSALGAALLAGQGAGLLDAATAAQQWAQVGPDIVPDPSTHLHYRQRFAAYAELYARNRDAFA